MMVLMVYTSFPVVSAGSTEFSILQNYSVTWIPMDRRRCVTGSTKLPALTKIRPRSLRIPDLRERTQSSPLRLQTSPMPASQILEWRTTVRVENPTMTTRSGLDSARVRKLTKILLFHLQNPKRPLQLHQTLGLGLNMSPHNFAKPPRTFNINHRRAWSN